MSKNLVKHNANCRRWRKANRGRALAIQARWRAKNPAHVRFWKLNSLAKRRGEPVLNMSLEEFKIWFDSQDLTRCQLRGCTITRPCVDHCHRTGKVRGILCHGCNSRLSAIEDRTFSKQAREYLKTHEKSSTYRRAR